MGFLPTLLIRKIAPLCCVPILCGGLVCRAAGPDASASAATQPGAVSANALDPASAAAQIASAIPSLTASSFAQRKAASGGLLTALMQQMSALMLLPGAETSGRGRTAVRVAARASLWALSLFDRVDSATAQRIVGFAFSPRVAPLLQGVFADDLVRQRETLAAIVAIDDPRASDFLAAMIGDPDGRRATLAIDVAYETKPTAPVLDALWWQACREFEPTPIQPQTLPAFQGKHVSLPMQYLQINDDNFARLCAANLLIKWQDSRTAAAFDRFIIERSRRDIGNSQLMAMLIQPQAMQQFGQLAKAFKSRAAVCVAAAIALGTRYSTNGGNINGRNVFLTNRTQALGLLSSLTGLDPADYGLMPFAWIPGDGQWCADTDAHETAAVEKFKLWWQLHRSDYAYATESATIGPDGVIRIDAGATVDYADLDGHVWHSDCGFVGGDVVDRGGLGITAQHAPQLYETEHWGMSSWAMKVPNGQYTVRLHFCETFEGVNAAGVRVFSVNIGTQEIKDLDIFKEAGGRNRPLVKTLDGVSVTNGILDIDFTAKLQATAINGLEIIPKK